MEVGRPGCLDLALFDIGQTGPANRAWLNRHAARGLVVHDELERGGVARGEGAERGVARGGRRDVRPMVFGVTATSFISNYCLASCYP